jgi:hypothetical protein
MVDQWTPIDVREMRTAWSVAPQTAAKNMSTVKAFFEYCVANDWIEKNPARLVKNQRSRDAADRRAEQKLPFSEDELKRMYDACGVDYGKQQIAWSRTIHHLRAEGEYARYSRKWTGQDLADFISVSVYTGFFEQRRPARMSTPGFQSGFRIAFGQGLASMAHISSASTRRKTVSKPGRSGNTVSKLEAHSFSLACRFSLASASLFICNFIWEYFLNTFASVCRRS